MSGPINKPLTFLEDTLDNNTLRIRETTTNGSPAIYAGVDIGMGGQLHRGKTTPAMVKDKNAPTIETVSFVYDTPHNRAYFLQRPTCETAVWQDMQWVVVPKSWLDKAFAPAIDGESDQPANPPGSNGSAANTGQSAKKSAKITSIADFEKLHKSQQGKALKGLYESEVHQDFKTNFLNNIVNSTSALIAHTVRSTAENYLKELANVKA